MTLKVKKTVDSPRFTNFVKKGKLLGLGDEYLCRTEAEADYMCKNGFERVAESKQWKSKAEPKFSSGEEG